MGAWGKGVFENDSALDWMDELIDADDQDLFYSALKEATESEYIEVWEASAVLVACEIIAASIGKPCKELPEEINNWIQEQQPVIDQTLINTAIEALKIVQNCSELKELWIESDKYQEWLQVIKELEMRIGGV